MSTQYDNLPAQSVSQPGQDASLRAAQAIAHRDRLLDEALAATFPCSDPVATLTIDEPADDLSEPMTVA
jgi:ABC-type phosphate transport system ATPase subunit